MKVLYVGGIDSAQKGAVGTHTLGVLTGFQQAGVDLDALFLDDQVPESFSGPMSLVTTGRGGKYYKKISDRMRIARRASGMASNYDYMYTRYDPFLSPFITANNLILEYNDDFLAQIDFTLQAGQFSGVGAAIRGSGLYRKLMKRIERHCFGRARTVVCVTKRLCDLVSERASCARTFCMLNGSDATFSPALDPKHPDSVLRIGHIGTLTHWDGLKELLYGLAEFTLSNSEKPIKLLIVGEGDLKPELVSLTRDLSLQNVVEFRDCVDHKTAVVCLHQVDVVPLLKTLASYDLSPIKFYEALCTGRFVLCSDIPHINQIGGEEGIVVGFPLSVAEISEAISALHARLPEIRNGFNVRSDVARQKHSWESRVRSLIEDL